MTRPKCLCKRTDFPGLDTPFATVKTRLLFAESSVVCSIGVYKGLSEHQQEWRNTTHCAVNELASYLRASRVCQIAIR